jgi:hypothetical protein
MNFTRMPIKGARTQAIDQVSISFVMNTSQQPLIDVFKFEPAKWTLGQVDERTGFGRTGGWWSASCSLFWHGQAPKLSTTLPV